MNSFIGAEQSGTMLDVAQSIEKQTELELNF
jgi:hypothetical protein